MDKIAKFERVSYEQYKKDFRNIYQPAEITDDEIKKIYDGIKLPRRATKGSAGYDFFTPFPFILDSTDPQITIPSGIRCLISDGWFLALYPRSGLGWKHTVRLPNTVGIIDSDYCDADNEGHIMIKLGIHENMKTVVVESDKAICQGIFMPFGITIDDKASGERTGGFGSTDKSEN